MWLCLDKLESWYKRLVIQPRNSLWKQLLNDNIILEKNGVTLVHSVIENQLTREKPNSSLLGSTEMSSVTSGSFCFYLWKAFLHSCMVAHILLFPEVHSTHAYARELCNVEPTNNGCEQCPPSNEIWQPHPLGPLVSLVQCNNLYWRMFDAILAGSSVQIL